MEGAGTAIHDELLAKFGSPTREDFYTAGAVRFVEAEDYVSLEFFGNSRVAVEHAIAALSGRWANRPKAEVDFVGPPGLISGSTFEVLQNLRHRLDDLGGHRNDRA